MKSYILKQFQKPTGLSGKLTGIWMNLVNKFMYNFTLELMYLNEEDKVLEVGFGNGKFLKKLESKVKFSAGIDISKTMIEEAQKKVQESELKLGSIENIPYKKETFNKIFTINTIYFWKKPKKAISELHRISKKGGQIYITLTPKKEMEGLSEYNFKLYETSQIEELLENQGFINIKTEKTNWLRIRKAVCIYGEK